MSRTRRIQRKKRKTRLLKHLMLAFIFAFLGLMVILGIAFASFAKGLPKLENQAIKKSPQTSKMYAADGTLVTDFFVEQNRVIIPLSQIPIHLQHGVIAIEDKRFYEHRGVDLEAIARAFVTNLEQGQIAEGGSTLTQQYVKNALIQPERTLTRKIKEAYLASQVEKKYSKKKILEKYLNTVYFGVNTYGIETAAETFFGKAAKDLSLAESALLAGVIKSPNRYSPYTFPERALARREAVLRRMAEQKYITEEEVEAAKSEPLTVQPIIEKKVPAPYFADYVKRLILEDPKYGSTPSQRANLVFKGGLRIYTTLDLKMQTQAEEATQLLNLPNDPSASIVAVDPKTGYIKALVGGKDFETNKYNLATQGKRQPGSSFKIFVLATALANGVRPTKIYQASPFTMKLPGKDWQVVNSNKSPKGKMTVRDGTVFSVNALFARLIMDVGPAKVAEMAKKMGIQTEIPAFPSISLGTVGVSPLEMASAASTLANMGVHNRPLAIVRITDAKGKVIEDNKVQGEQVLEPAVAYAEIDILKEVIQRGTGKAASIGRPAAGKTGTTNSYRDAWFVGFTPDLTAAVWVGYPQAQIAMNSVHGIRVQGGTFPAQIWAKFMSSALSGTPPSNFQAPANAQMPAQAPNIKVTVCTDMDYLATTYCPKTTTKYFKAGSEPTQPCPVHQGVSVPDVIGISLSTAVSTLKEAGFKVQETFQASPTVISGIVIAQDPREGTVKQGSKVTIVISRGPEMPRKVAVPSVLGMSENQAVNTLGASGFTPSIYYSKSSSEAGKVIRQSPSGGTQKTRGGRVMIIVATP